ncbi:YdcF family protein [Hyphomicrobium methylovorum]|uniref:YdcF family protein n=1 Tax=Hyphomicrobium methylovorum TaxID=84 RepID=UPI0015E746B6|nr:YdcF family protein [Hyphomicrobium methylovorum]MBA2125740.1 YdcF family protein [Hyphomicrobium methylovorum]
MRTIWKWLVLLLAVSTAALAFGFVIFAVTVTRDDASGLDKADGIVVLTGGELRMEAGAKLLGEGRAKRMLISGVNRKVTREEMRRLLNLQTDTFNCCVDLGYEALDTVGNADETRTWAKSNGYTKLIIVTSRYHMPRSLAELALAMPGVTLIPYAVTPRRVPETTWWLHASTTRVLLSEYLKYLPAMARLTAQRVLDWRDGESVAAAGPKHADG